MIFFYANRHKEKKDNYNLTSSSKMMEIILFRKVSFQMREQPREDAKAVQSMGTLFTSRGI